MLTRAQLTGKALVLQIDEQAMIMEERSPKDWLGHIGDPKVVLDGV